METSCEKIEELLVDYADSQLSPSEATKVAEHLQKCESCRKILAALNKSLELTEIIWADGLSETKKLHVPTTSKHRKIHWAKYVTAAAVILLVITTSTVWRTLKKPAKPSKKEINFADIERRINNAGNAARLLAATELLAEYPDSQSIVKEQYRYIIETYPETASATQAKMKIQ
jgi:hypothetical protein